MSNTQQFPQCKVTKNGSYCEHHLIGLVCWTTRLQLVDEQDRPSHNVSINWVRHQTVNIRWRNVDCMLLGCGGWNVYKPIINIDMLLVSKTSQQSDNVLLSTPLTFHQSILSSLSRRVFSWWPFSHCPAFDSPKQCRQNSLVSAHWYTPFVIARVHKQSQMPSQYHLCVSLVAR